MTKATNYQCPACGGPLHFGGASNKLECDYCGSSYEVSYIDNLYKEKIDAAKKENKQEENLADAQAETFDKESSAEKINLKSYNCPSCGAQLFCDEVTASVSCPYCGNNQVIATQFNGGKMPDMIIPFKLDKNSAIEGLKKHYKGKKLLPSVFSTQNHIEEVKGVYVPFWLFDGKVDADLDFTATRSKTSYTSTETITTTSHYKINRKGSVSFDKISVDASKKMDDALMDTIEPFDYDQMVPFSTSYLPGFFAEVYDVSEDECFERAKKRAENTAVDEISNSVTSYESVNIVNKNIKVIKEKTLYAFLPVWVLSTKWKDKNFIFAMNGQTGEMVGNLPVDKGKFFKYLMLITLGVAAVVTPIVYFLF